MSNTPTDPEIAKALTVFYTGILNAIRAMPVKLFPSEDHRLRAMAAAQEVLEQHLFESDQES